MIWAQLMWASVYVNSDSRTAAILPLVVSVALIGDPIDVSRPITGAFHRFEVVMRRLIATLWGLTIMVAVLACVMVAFPARGTTVTIQAAVQGEGVEGAGYCGSSSCDLPSLRFVKAAGILTQFYYCGNDDGDACGSKTATTGLVSLVVEMANGDGDDNNDFVSGSSANNRVKSFRFQLFDSRIILVPQYDFDKTFCGENFSFVVARNGVLLWDILILRCNDLVIVTFLMGASIEIGREPDAVDGTQCAPYRGVDIEHPLGSRGATGHWWLSAESIRSIDDGMTLLVVGKGLIGLESVFEDLEV